MRITSSNQTVSSQRSIVPPAAPPLRPFPSPLEEKANLGNVGFFRLPPPAIASLPLQTTRSGLFLPVQTTEHAEVEQSRSIISFLSSNK